MKINNTQSYKPNNNKNNISYKGDGARKFVRLLANPDARTPTIMLEGAVTGGRGYNAYKRGGVNELRERATDDIISAFFWIEGVNIFNKLGDKFGQKFLKLPTTEFDIGKDALRKPFENVVKDLPKMGISPENVQKAQKKLATFKLCKILSASILSTTFIGFALPRINQGITKFFMTKNAAEEVKKPNKQIQNNQSVTMGYVSIDEFTKEISNKNTPSFKGKLDGIAHALENNKICKLLTSDVGITSGRVVSARNKDEAFEYLFRDLASTFFYSFSTPLIYLGLQKATKSKGITSIDPVAAKQLNQKLLEQLEAAGGSMTASDFAQKALGSLDEAGKKLLKELPFENDVISVKEFIKHTKDKDIIKRAARMSRLQPNQANVGGVLTKQQVTDVLKNGSVNSPEFLKKVYTEHFGENLTNKYRFIPMKKIVSFKDNIDDYVNSVVKHADNGVITKDVLNKVNKKGFAMSAGFRAIAMGLSAIALGIIIPKVQYAITAKRTGSNAAPGLREYENQENKKA